jgi:hypothetical protein
MKRLSTVVFLAALAGPGALLAADVDFIRGDANYDGSATFSDVYLIGKFLFMGGAWPSCLSASDANDDGRLDLRDLIDLTYAVWGGVPLPAPYPAAGPDPTKNEGDHASSCESYGGGSPIEDPAARLRILDAEAAGGSDATFSLRVAVSASIPTAGVFLKLPAEGGAIASMQTVIKDLVNGPKRFRFAYAMVEDGAVRLGVISSMRKPVTIPAGEDIEAFEFIGCLAQGTKAGEYPLALDAGELVDADSSRAIIPALEGATLRVLADVTEDAVCPEVPSEVVPPDDTENPPPDAPPLNGTFQLGDVKAAPGTEAVVPFSIRADVPVQGYSFSIDFDETVLTATEVEVVWGNPGGDEYCFSDFESNNDDLNPGSAGVDEGFVVGAAVFSCDRPAVMPADTDNLALRLHFLVKPEAATGATEIRFLAGGRVGPGGNPVSNRITASGLDYTPELATSFIFLNGRVNVLPEPIVFRGDSNLDGNIDLSDAIFTLSFLFLGHPSPACRESADFNSDGALDISDAVSTMEYLFLGGDPSSDDLVSCPTSE